MAKKDIKASVVVPLGDRILIKPFESEDKTPMGIIIPDSAKKKESKEGVVIAIGAGKTLDEGGVRAISGVKVGDKVLYRQGWDNEVDIADVKHYLVSEGDVLAVIK